MKKIQEGENLSIIDERVIIKGDIIGRDSDFLIRGNVQGNIKAKKVTIAKEGKVNADIETETILINGMFEGSVTSNLFKVLQEGSCKGKVVCQDINIQEGGVMNSEVQVVKAGETVNKKEKIEQPLLSQEKNSTI